MTGTEDDRAWRVWLRPLRWRPLGIRIPFGTLLLAVLAIAIGLPAAFPWLRWRRRLGWRGQLVVVVLDTAWRTFVGHRVGPPMMRFARANDARREQARRDLVAELGREPTAAEVAALAGERARAEVAARDGPPPPR